MGLQSWLFGSAMFLPRGQAVSESPELWGPGHLFKGSPESLTGSNTVASFLTCRKPASWN